MPAILRRTCFTVLAFSLAISISFARTGAASQGSGTGSSTIGCRVLESKPVSRLGITLVIFHQAESADRDSLGAFLRIHDGTRIEFQPGDGSWQPASVLRLKSSFGRGLLVLPRGAAQLREGDKFLLRSAASDER